MAKRKRLAPTPGPTLGPGAAFGEGSAPETKAVPPSVPPIASVAGNAAAEHALAEVAGEMRRAREEGRLIETIPLDRIDMGYITRDRVAVQAADMEVLRESLRARGQQTPIEVVALPGKDGEKDGAYGLISGWRRLTALKDLHAETGEARFGRVDALIRTPETAADAYVAMVEENEIRVGLSYYERANVVVRAVQEGVFENQKKALQGLFASASRAKRSKIKSFLPVVEELGHVLEFPEAIPERLGLRLARAIEVNRALYRHLLTALPGANAEEEIAIIETSLEAEDRLLAERDGVMPPDWTEAPSDRDPGATGSVSGSARPITGDESSAAGRANVSRAKHSGQSKGGERHALGQGIEMEVAPDGAVTLRGRALTEDLRADLRGWLTARLLDR